LNREYSSIGDDFILPSIGKFRPNPDGLDVDQGNVPTSTVTILTPWIQTKIPNGDIQ
jgi:hypothetical protein